MDSPPEAQLHQSGQEVGAGHQRLQEAWEGKGFVPRLRLRVSLSVGTYSIQPNGLSALSTFLTGKS